MAKKKTKHMTGIAFSIDVCDAIRHHIGERMALDSNRVIAREDRDAAVEEKNQIEDHDCDEYLEACKWHSDAIALIDSLAVRIKFHRNQVDELVEKADEPQLDFMYDMPVEPRPKQLKLADAAKDERPVGVPPKKGSGPAKPDGVDEHLKAAVSELEISDDLARSCVNAGYTTVGELAHAIDTGVSLQTIGRGVDNAKAIEKAVGKYRKKHRSAIVEVERAAKEKAS